MTSPDAADATAGPRLTWRVPDDRRLPALEPYADDVRRTPPVTVRDTIWDTADRVLAAEGIELARDGGASGDGGDGGDAGWTLDRGAGPVSVPASAAARAGGPDDPEGMPRDAVDVFLRGRPVRVVGVRDTTTTLVRLHSRGGRLRVEVADVRSDVGDPDDAVLRSARWWALADDGSERAVVRRIERALADAADGPALVVGDDVAARPDTGETAPDRHAGRPAGARAVRDSSAAAFVVGALRPLRAALVDADPRVRADEADAVHDLRKALRRIRSVLSAFHGALDPEATGPLRDAFRAVGRTAGVARDAEVVAGGVLRSAARTPQGYVDAVTLERLRAQVGELRDAAAADLRETLRTDDWYGALDALDRILTEVPPGRHADDDAGPFVTARVDRERRRLRRAVDRSGAPRSGADAADGDGPLDSVHAVRKAARRVRYAVEAADGVGDLGRRRIGRLRRVQDTLGEGIDAVHAAEAYRRIAGLAQRGEEDTFAYGALATAEHVVAEDRLVRGLRLAEGL